MSEESSAPSASETLPESSAPVDSPDTTPPAPVVAVAVVEPVRPFTLQTPANLRILFHLPPQGRGYTGKINNLFFYTDTLGRIDKNGAHQWDGGMHVFDGRLLTVEEFLTPRVQKYLADDSLAIRPLVRAVMLPDGLAPVEAPAPVISIEDMRSLVDQLDQLRQTLATQQARIDELESENSTYKQAIERIEADAKGQPAPVETPPADGGLDLVTPPPADSTDVTPPEPQSTADAPPPAPAPKAKSHKKK